jgi:peroxiredoxin
MISGESGSPYVFVLSKGLERDTIQKGTLGFAGNAVINIPSEYENYKGMGFLQVKDNTIPVSMIVAGEDFSVEMAGKTPKFTGSKENTYLYGILEKKELVKDTSLYANRFIDIMQYVQRQSKALSQGGDLTEKAELRQYAQNKLDMECLYTSSLWYFVIDNMVKLSESQEALGKDIVKILSRTHSQEVFEALSGDIVTITEQFGLDDAFDIIVPYIQASERIKTPKGKMFDAFTMAKIRKGMQAPAIQGYKKQTDIAFPDKTVVIFYDPDCHNCEVQLEQLIKDYEKLKMRNIQVISISSSMETDEHSKDFNRFPWTNKLCDYKGFAGNNFKNYGVLGTPTIFLLDKDNKVLGRYALVSKMNLLN